jgi:hypothetical protein
MIQIDVIYRFPGTAYSVRTPKVLCVDNISDFFVTIEGNVKFFEYGSFINHRWRNDLNIFEISLIWNFSF